MTHVTKLAVVLCCCSAALIAQTSAASVQATGTATIYVQPDQAQLIVSVTTTATTATAAGQQNANVTVAVTQAIAGVLGANGSIQTVSYSVDPRYNTGTATQPSTIVGYAATNTFQVTMTDLTLIGHVIDTANQAGATSVGSLILGLQNPSPSMQQALAAASKQALANAGAIASGLGGKTGAVISAQQSSAYTPVVAVAGATSATTPVQAGPVSVSATVTVTVQLQ
jgi:uncharacterized protein YggE